MAIRATRGAVAPPRHVDSAARGPRQALGPAVVASARPRLFKYITPFPRTRGPHQIVSLVFFSRFFCSPPLVRAQISRFCNFELLPPWCVLIFFNFFACFLILRAPPPGACLIFWSTIVFLTFGTSLAISTSKKQCFQEVGPPRLDEIDGTLGKHRYLHGFRTISMSNARVTFLTTMFAEFWSTTSRRDEQTA